MSASVLFAGALAATAVLSVAEVTAGSMLVTRHALAATADSVALAAADTASGLRPGSPCEAASSLARVQAAVVDACRIDGQTATVRVVGAVGPIPLAAVATAGQPPDSHRLPTARSKK